MRYQVSLDDLDLSNVSHLIRITDVIELQPDLTNDTKERLGAAGSYLVRSHLKARKVRVQFALLTSDITERTAVLSEITAWAVRGKFLKIGDRPGQLLRVVCTELPTTTSKRKWTDLCEMTFSAFAVPYWEDVAGVSMMATGTKARLTLSGPGNVEQVPLRCRITPEQTLSSVRIRANGAEMAFSGLAVPAGETFTVDYVDGLLTASWTAEDGTVTPCLRYRTGVEIVPILARKANQVEVDTDVAAAVTINAKGWYW